MATQIDNAEWLQEVHTAGELGAEVHPYSTPQQITDARLEEIERRILLIESGRAM